MSFSIGIDVGGTFTDIVVAGPDGQTIIAKAATTPADQSAGVLDGIVLAAGLLGLTPAALLADTSRIVHGTTVATNALLEGKTAPRRPADHRGPSRRHRNARGPEARTLQSAHGAAGAVGAAPAAPAGARTNAARRIDRDAAGPRLRWITPSPSSPRRTSSAVAICFLHAWRNPEHEQAPPSPCGRGCSMLMSPPPPTCCRRSRSSSASPPPSPTPRSGR